ncbi:MAG: DUF6760 family protein [bacterium]
MPSLLQRVFSGGAGTAGGIIGYPLERIYEEVAFLSYYLHWDYETIMDMHHRERNRWVGEVSKINGKIQDAAGGRIS